MPDAPTVEAVDVPGRTLAGNPLGDSVARRVAVVRSVQGASVRPTLIYWLPGFGGSSEDILRNGKVWGELVGRLAEKIGPTILVAIDGRNRWGGSQYIDSTAQGDYGRYLCDEIVPLVERRFGRPKDASRRVLAGHSSGGFGALRLGVRHRKRFGKIVAMSPDSDFPTTHRSIVEDASVRKISPETVAALMTPDPAKCPKLGGEGPYVAALSAAYAPVGPRAPGKFEWIYSADGKIDERVWRRWLDSDPLEIVRRNPRAFAPSQSVYLDGGATDEFKANIGARKIFEALQPRKSRSTFYESPGGHGAHYFERIERGILWSLLP